MKPILSIQNLNKIYAGGFQALKNVNLEVHKGEIFKIAIINDFTYMLIINCQHHET